MANEYMGPTLYGKPVGGVRAFFQGTDPRYNAVPTREGYQQLTQLGMLAPTLGRLAFGFGAPSIAPAAREARRQYHEETVPQLMEQFAGGGSQGALLRGIQGAGSDLESKLGALQMQQQFELQKQRQEQLPRLLELGLSPSFQPVLTDKPIAGLPGLQSEQIAQNPYVQELIAQTKGAGEDVAQLAERGIYGARKAGRMGIEAGRELGGMAQAGIEKYITPEFSKRFPKFAQRLQDISARAHVPQKLPAYIKKAATHGVNPQLQAQLTPEHFPMIQAIASRSRGGWREALNRMTDLGQLEELYRMSQGKVSKRELRDFLKSLAKPKRGR